MKAGQTVEEGAQELSKAGVRVLESRKREGDGKIHMQVCGTETGTANLYRIPKADLEKMPLGYEETKIK